VELLNILIIGGTRYIGIHLVQSLLECGHTVTIATRGYTKDNFGNKVNRLKIDRTNADDMKRILRHAYFDVIFDNIALCSNDVRNVLEVANCDKYVITSSASVYAELHIDIKEDEFIPETKKLVWCDKTDFPYGELKRQAECALFQKYNNTKAVAVRFPFIMGKDDYICRLFFYVDSIINNRSIYVDNIDQQMSVVRSDEAGKFLSCFAKTNYLGTINGCSEGTIKLRDIFNYIEKKTGKSPKLKANGQIAPLNGVCDFSLNINRAKNLGFTFTPINNWIYDLLDFYISEVSGKKANTFISSYALNIESQRA
jgi:nucleoside-diphosphate-sugar epimerase